MQLMGDAVKAHGATAAPATHNRSSGRSHHSLASQPSQEIDMQTQAHIAAPALSSGKLIAAASALLIGAAVLAYGVPRTANAAASFTAQPVAEARMHDGVDWSRVAAAPVDTGATVGAYDR
jgi:hypothetical protein